MAGTLLATAPAQAAEAAAKCPDRWICLYEHQDGRGGSISFPEGSPGSDDLSKVPCPTCEGGGTFANRLSSFINNTSQTWWAFYETHGRGERHNMNPTGNRVLNLLLSDEDKVSSIYSWR
ncbi:hypothetical protein GCM10022247_66810 [Allokutzneria multivorans]|uniref:Peptidase inhibitor family I36 n=1 Tax=Allokutzneria multivorans TaxID=1142134 RepID=A0ABP7TWR1_9PSEU